MNRLRQTDRRARATGAAFKAAGIALFLSVSGVHAAEGLLVVLQTDDGQQSMHQVLVERATCLKALDQVQASKAPGAERLRLTLSDPPAKGTVLDAYCIEQNGTIIKSNRSTETRL